jgi:arabinose-5-phosphate isomerase
MNNIIKMLKATIEAEADAIAKLAGMVDEHWVHAIETLDRVRRAGGLIIVCGVGKSGHVGRKIAASLASTGAPSVFVHGTEASHGDLGLIKLGDVVLMLTASGSTVELLDTADYCRSRGIPLILVTRNPASRIGRFASIILAIPDVPEACPNGLAPTTSSTATLVAGDALAVALMTLVDFSKADFGQYHPGGKLGDSTRRLADLMAPAVMLTDVAPSATLGEAIIAAAAGKPISIAGRGIDATVLVRLAAAAGTLDTTIELLLPQDMPVGSPGLVLAEARKLPGAASWGVSVVENGIMLGFVGPHLL